MPKNEAPNTETAGQPEQAQEPDTLAEGGRKALEAEREARKRAEREAREKAERLAELERAEARRRVAKDKGLTEAQAAFLRGENAEEMAAEADRLLDAFKAEEPLQRRPVENVRPGAVPTADPTRSIEDVADRVRSGL